MFKFRLQRVLDLRLREEQEKAVDLAAARSEEQRVRETCESLEAAREKSVRSVAASAAAGPTVGQLQNLRLVIDRLNEQLDDAHQQAHHAEQTVQQRMQDLTAAFRDRRVLDKLRERRLKDWQAAEEHHDRTTMDAIALNRFVRTGGGASEPETD